MKKEELELKKLQHKRYLTTEKNYFYITVILFIPILTGRLDFSNDFVSGIFAAVLILLLIGATTVASRNATEVEEEIEEAIE